MTAIARVVDKDNIYTTSCERLPEVTKQALAEQESERCEKFTRYDFDMEACDGESGRCYARLIPDADGDYVLYSEVARLEECLKRINARAISIMADLSDDQPSWHDAQRINRLCDDALGGDE